MENTIFISYSTKNLRFTEVLHARLIEQGFNIWWDKTNIQPIHDWPTEIATALKNCDLMILVISIDSMASKQVEREWFYFIERNKPIICIWLEDCEINFQLGLHQRIDFREQVDLDRKYNYLFTGINDGINSILRDRNSDFAPEEKKGKPFNKTATLEIERYSWADLTKLASDHTKKILFTNYKQKFDPKFHTQRQDIQYVLNDFVESQFKFICITGKAGMGKSSFVCSFASSYMNKIPVLLFDCSDFVEDNIRTLDSYLAKKLNFNTSFETILKTVADSDKNPLILIFDGVNEYIGKSDGLLENISALINRYSPYNVKFIMTCRLPAWNRLSNSLKIPVGLAYEKSQYDTAIEIGDFSVQEQENAYNLYNNKYQYKQRFYDLSPQVSKLISNPLFMKLVLEAYSNNLDKKIPVRISLRELFKRYIENSLKNAHPDASDAMKLLSRTISLMYKERASEISVDMLKQTLGNLLEQAYKDLLDSAIIAEKEGGKNIMQSALVIFVTYERVLEFLLAEIIQENSKGLVPLQIYSWLDIARGKFIQLRGAAELVLSFALLSGDATIEIVVDMAKEGKTDSRQFLVDVIQTVNSEKPETAIEIIVQLLRTNSTPCILVAMLASYQLNLEDYLIKIALHKDEYVAGVACIYLYYRWTFYKERGDLTSAYDILRKIANKLSLVNIKEAKAIVRALINLVGSILPNIVDSPKSVAPLAETLRSTLEKIPGFKKQSGLRGLAGSAIFILISQSVLSAITRYNIDQFADHEAFYANYKFRRALVDTNLGVDIPDLTNYKDVIYDLLHLKNSLTRFTLPAILFVHLNQDIKANIDIVQSIFESTSDTEVHYWLTFALFSAVMNSLFRGDPVPEEYHELLRDYFYMVWQSRHNETELNETQRTFFTENLLTYLLLHEEAFVSSFPQGHKEIGVVLNTILLQPSENDTDDIKSVLGAIEKACYHRPERMSYFVELALDPVVKSCWLKDTPVLGVTMLAKLRTLNQELIDNLILKDVKHGEKLLTEVRAAAEIPNTESTTLVQGQYLYLPISTQVSIIKVYGAILLDISTAENLDEGLSSVLKTVQDSIFNYQMIEVKIVTWWKLNHTEEWNNYARWGIQEDILEKHPKETALYHNIYSEFIAKSSASFFGLLP